MKTKLYILALFFLVSCGTKKTVIRTSPTTKIPTTTGTVASSWAFQENKNTNLNEVLEKAKAEKKLVFLDAYATWCAPCKVMDKEVFTDKNAAAFFNKNFISYKVNVEKGNGETIKLLYSVDVLPTLLFLNANGDVLVRNESGIGTTELKAMADQALRKAKK